MFAPSVLRASWTLVGCSIRSINEQQTSFRAQNLIWGKWDASSARQPRLADKLCLQISISLVLMIWTFYHICSSILVKKSICSLLFYCKCLNTFVLIINKNYLLFYTFFTERNSLGDKHKTVSSKIIFVKPLTNCRKIKTHTEQLKIGIWSSKMFPIKMYRLLSTKTRWLFILFDVTT